MLIEVNRETFLEDVVRGVKQENARVRELLVIEKRLRILDRKRALAIIRRLRKMKNR